MVTMRNRTSTRCRAVTRNRGFTYLWVLGAIAVMGIGLLGVSELWTATTRRQKLDELDWVGQQFRDAIGSYYQSSTGLTKSYPSSLQELLEDRRYAVPRRHLRVIYRNPITGTTEWETIRSTEGKVRGVRVVLPPDNGGQVKEFVNVPAG